MALLYPWLVCRRAVALLVGGAVKSGQDGIEQLVLEQGCVCCQNAPMSRNRIHSVDKAKTASLQELVPFERQRKKNWLDHSDGSAFIDVMLLVGGTIDQLKSPTRPTAASVEDHLRHLTRDHGLHVVCEDGLYRFGNQAIAP